MALPGMKSTADFAADERPKDWRTALMINEVRNGAPLFRLTAAMKSERTADPEFKWWEEDQDMLNFVLSADITNVATTIPLISGGLSLKPGDLLRAEQTGEVMRVSAVASATSITVARAWGAGGSPAGTATAIDTPVGGGTGSPLLLYMGSAFREGAPRPTGTTGVPTQYSNLCQIFRDAVEWTNTAIATEYRTGDPRANDRRRALNKHSVGIERMLWLGSKYETLESGQPVRTTEGLLNRIPAGNIKTVTAGGVDLDEFEEYMEGIFQYGSAEKLAFASVATMIKLGQIVRKNSNYDWGPAEKEYGMNVRRFHGPAGTLTLTEHPMFGQAGGFLYRDLVVVPTDKLKWRYIRDTSLLKDRENRGDDGKAEEYLTEGGLQLGSPREFYWLKGLLVAAKDN